MRNDQNSYEWIKIILERKGRLLQSKAAKNIIKDTKKRTLERIRINSLTDEQVLKELRILK